MSRINRVFTFAIAGAVLSAGCGGSSDSSADRTANPAAAERPADAGGAVRPAPGATPDGGAATTDLDRTPLSAADYALYAAIMGGASAMLADLSPEDRKALELEKKLGSGTPAAASAEAMLARARDLHRADEQLARMQGIDARYLKVKEKVDAAIGSHARPPADGDTVAQENRRFLEAHRRNIERLQKILADPLTREPSSGLRVD
jgi:hypothetical protein